MSDSGPEVDSGFPELYVSAWSELEDNRRKSEIGGVWRVGSGLRALGPRFSFNPARVAHSHL